MTPQTMLLEDGSEITVVHFLYQKKYGKPTIACVPGLESFCATQYRPQPWIRTNETRSVNCPVCKATKEYEEAVQELRALTR